jgi:hypothetical protein
VTALAAKPSVGQEEHGPHHEAKALPLNDFQDLLIPKRLSLQCKGTLYRCLTNTMCVDGQLHSDTCTPTTLFPVPTIPTNLLTFYPTFDPPSSRYTPFNSNYPSTHIYRFFNSILIDNMDVSGIYRGNHKKT